MRDICLNVGEQVEANVLTARIRVERMEPDRFRVEVVRPSGRSASGGCRDAEDILDCVWDCLEEDVEDLVYGKNMSDVRIRASHAKRLLGRINEDRDENRRQALAALREAVAILEEVAELPETQRGEGGFGSTGV